jgi:hypothetical protein
MTQPIDGKETRVVSVAGRAIMVRPLVDTQMVHIMRHARILQKDDVAVSDKLESADRLFTILHKMVVQPADLAFLVEQEEEGEVELKDLMAFLEAFKDEEEAKPKARRGRPPAKRS